MNYYIYNIFLTYNFIVRKILHQQKQTWILETIISHKMKLTDQSLNPFVSGDRARVIYLLYYLTLILPEQDYD